MKIEERLNKLKIKLPPAPKPVGLYVTSVKIGDMIYLSGTGSVDQLNLNVLVKWGEN